MKVLLGIVFYILGLFTSSLYDRFVNKFPKFDRKCVNCKYCITAMGKDNRIHHYCSIADLHNVTQFPVSECFICGHFDFTEEIKAEQVRINAEKLMQKEAVHGKKKETF